MPIAKQRCVFLLLPILWLCGCDAQATSEGQPEEALRLRALAVLRDALNSGHDWPKVHAAECLLALDYPQGVHASFEQERTRRETEPRFRIGIWRVLAQATYIPREREPWIAKIIEAFVDPKGPDRIHAVETLAKLRVPLPGAAREAAVAASASSDPVMATLATWTLAAGGDRQAGAKLAQRLTSEDVTSRRLAAYALRFQTNVSDATRRTLVEAANAEPIDSAARVYLVSAALVHAGPKVNREPLREALIGYLRNGSEAEKYEAANAFAVAGLVSDIPLLEAMLDDSAADARVGAANAILHTQRKGASHVSRWDWLVIASYGLGILGVGFYYAGKTKTADAYLLGNRRMRPWAAGLSLFAGTFSTITFLAIPGEIIKNGPMILTQLLAFPLVYWVIGWFVIPFFMRLKVTSAYEILESRFNLSVRLLGSALFLVAKVVWMAVIIYATTDKVLVPQLHIDPRFAPWVCILLGGLTIIYTSLGGLRAVVMADVAHSFVLAGGALVCLLLITIHMGGVAAWFPMTWAANWEAPRFGFQLDTRIAMGWMLVGAFLWFFCTASSDQVAIQRYLATRDAKAGRGVMRMSLIAVTLINIFLALVGLALLALYRNQPYLLGPGQSITGTPDRLLPQYIAFGLPPGLTGLVVAGLLAAAMSSLASGLNASSSVISVDFLSRFSRTQRSDRAKVWMAKGVSVVIGLVVVAISSYVSIVPGNLLEIAFRVINLFVVPLFILFGMAIFVPWSTSFGVWAGTLASVGSAVTISFWEVLTGQPGPSFLLIMPVAFVAGMGVGMLASLLPIGAKAKTALSPAPDQ
ncbi:MAG: hypothetical protein JXA69_16980 [Phycisphaerae bacterium]|nr:hypothetical protein [Phycisphaerae bacterium]